MAFSIIKEVATNCRHLFYSVRVPVEGIGVFVLLLLEECSAFVYPFWVRAFYSILPPFVKGLIICVYIKHPLRWQPERLHLLSLSSLKYKVKSLVNLKAGMAFLF